MILCDDQDRFDWRDDEVVVVRSQPATAVYFNPGGELIVRQERGLCEEGDTIIILSRANAIVVGQQLLALASEEPAEHAEPKNAPAADRRRRKGANGASVQSSNSAEQKASEIELPIQKA